MIQALVDNSLPDPSDSISLARSVLTGNETGGGGAILSFADASAALGNVILARNTATGGAALTGTRLRVVYTVVADNAAAGIGTAAGAVLALGNSAVMRNAPNCALAQPILALGPNMQHPGSDCGPQARVTDPGLDGSYAPALISSARDAGDTGLCVSETTIGGIDLYGNSRIGTGPACDVGAVERKVFDTLAAALTFDERPDLGDCLRWLLLFLMFLAFVVVLLIRWRRKWRA